MSSQIIVSNEYITIEFHQSRGVIQHTIHKPIEDQVFKDALNAGTDFLEENGIIKWLSDDRKNGPLSETVLEWAFTDWNPRTIAAGWKYWANVVPEEQAAAKTLAPVINDLHSRGLHMMVFTTVDEALEWLDTQE